MAVSNRERVGRALELLAQGLLPFVEQEMTAVYGDRWLYAAAESLEAVGVSARKEQLGDVQNLLKVMWGQWNEVFKRTLGHSERNWVSELRTVRNDWAHQKPFSADDAYRALDTVQRLLTAVSSEGAIEVERQKQELNRQRYEEQARQAARKVQASETILGQPKAGLLPWRQVVTPHPDVASGRYQQAEFAADLAQVHRGEGTDEYRDPREFFRRTFITAGLRQLLTEALRRLAGTGGDPVVELQTNFGGGKTHSLLALYHLCSGTSAADLPGVEEILSAAGVTEVPPTARAVIVGTSLSPGQPQQKPDGTVANTLWGEIAWQLGGAEGYALVQQADTTGTNPGSALNELFKRHAPCLILIDEWVAYARQLYGKDDRLAGGSFDAHFTFAQTLTEAARAVPGVLVVVSIPASDVLKEDEGIPSSIEIGGEGGQAALQRLKQVIGRMHSPWRPASKEEGFEIVRRRLFEENMDHTARDAVVGAFADLYRSQHQSFPSDCKEGTYERRLRSAYPIHPELFDRLYEDWSTLERFQRTRGVLRLMAAVIHELWDRDDGNLLIMPGTVPIDAQAVEFELTRYLEDNWVPVIQKDVDGDDSTPVLIDRDNPALKRYSATRRVARTVYLGSAPTLKAAHRGLDDKSITLGCVQPGETPAHFGDALRRLTDQATYLYVDGSRYWFSPQPSVARLARDRAEQFLSRADDEVVRRLRADRRRGDFYAVHPAPTGSAEVPDEPEARLVILDPVHGHSGKTAESPARVHASQILATRGEGPRRRRNALVFLAADQDRLGELREAVANYLAWSSILGECDELGLDAFQRNQAQTKGSQWNETIDARLNETYSWLLVPSQGDLLGEAEWLTTRLTGTEAPADRAGRRLKNDGNLVTDYGGVALRYELDRIPLWRGDHVSIRQLWEDFTQYLYLPRLTESSVLLRAVQSGIAQLSWLQDSFAYAEAYDEAAGRYRGLKAGEHGSVTLDGLVVKAEVAKAQLDAERQRAVAPDSTAAAGAGDAGGAGGAGEAAATPDIAGGATGAADSAVPDRPRIRRFFASKKLDSLRPGRDFDQISEAVLQHLGLLQGATVDVTVEIHAELPSGAPDNVVRTVTENCGTLKFETHGFERE
ncbi:MAG: DUF499 domain-containing protein [Actinobacteria bacterium]|nr:DUF499 domain-containing protein [Actinomycetota bacterium]